MHILIVEDEKKVAAFIADGLGEQGWQTRICHDGLDALEACRSTSFDALVLDIMLPGLDGLALLKNLRAARNNVPVILLSARGDVEDRVEGLDLGADDYLPKPFSVSELVARLKAVWRRRSGDSLSVVSYADLTLNLHTREARRGGQKIELTTREFALLEFLLRTPEKVATRTALMEHVWGYHFDTKTNLVDVGVQRLRRKLDDGFSVKLIQTIRGVGYSLQKSE